MADTADARLGKAVDELVQARQAIYRAAEDLRSATDGLPARELHGDVVTALVELPELLERVGDQAQNLMGATL